MNDGKRRGVGIARELRVQIAIRCNRLYLQAVVQLPIHAKTNAPVLNVGESRRGTEVDTVAVFVVAGVVGIVVAKWIGRCDASRKAAGSAGCRIIVKRAETARGIETGVL